MSNNSTSKIYNATKWSAITNIFSKITPPITNMILARLLTPDAFGIITSINLVITFADIFTDAGFQKYIVQHEFENDEKLFNATNVAFWSNFILSIFAWIIICIFRNPIAEMVGSPGYGIHLIVAAFTIPILSFSSIQQAIFKRDFDFKGLFVPRIIRSIIPLCITVPLAFCFRNCWALIIGTLCANLSDAIILTIKSRWKPEFYFSKAEFSEMFGFSFWTLLESIAIWCSVNIDIFIISRKLDVHYLGIYKTSMVTVNQITGLITTTIIPVLFSALSRAQNERIEFFKIYLKFQRICALFVIPLSVGMFVFKVLVTYVLLGNQWNKAVNYIGLLGLASSTSVLISNFASEVYRAKGSPKTSFVIQVLFIIEVAIGVWLAIPNGFEVLCFTRFLTLFVFAFMHLFTLCIIYKFNFFKMIFNFIVPVFCSLLMGLEGMILLKMNDSIFFQIIDVIVCMFSYLLLLLCFPYERRIVYKTIRKILQK